jgi:hypothetical protein
VSATVFPPAVALLFFLYEVLPMQDNDAQQLLTEIINYAEQAKQSEFQFITSWQEFMFYRKKHKSTKLVIKVMQKCATNLLNTYCKDIASGYADVTQLLAYTQFLDIIAFYKNELDTLKLMLDEYDEYLGHGNFWKSFLGGERDISMGGMF